VQWFPLYKLAQAQDITMAHLARDFQIDPAAMSRSLDRIESKGLVVRRRSQSDRRVVHLELTSEGRVVAEKVKGVLAGVLNDHLRGFSQQEWETLVQLLTKMLQNGEAMRMDLTPLK
jgi:DNA-binding MarR family transcriptional regulator